MAKRKKHIVYTKGKIEEICEEELSRVTDVPPAIIKRKPQDNHAVYKQYKKLIDKKALPDFWQRKYELVYSRLRRYYKKTEGLENPMFELLLEKIAYITAKLRYMESEDFKDEGYDVNDPSSIMLMGNLVATLNKTCEQVMKYSMTTRKENISKSLSVRIKQVHELSDKELDERLRSIVTRPEASVDIAD